MEQNLEKERKVLQSVYMQLGSEKFVELQLNTLTLEISIVQGNLNGDEQVPDSIQTGIEKAQRLDEAMEIVAHWINIKLEEGYMISVEEKEINIEEICDRKEENKQNNEEESQQVDVIEKEVDIGFEITEGLYEEIQANATNWKVQCEKGITATKIMISGEKDLVDRFKVFLAEALAALESERKRENKPPVVPNNGLHKKSIPITEEIMSLLSGIQNQAKEFKVEYAQEDQFLVLTGDEDSVNRLLHFIEELLSKQAINKLLEEEEKLQAEAPVPFKKGFKVTADHLYFKEAIEIKMLELNVKGGQEGNDAYFIGEEDSVNRLLLYIEGMMIAAVIKKKERQLEEEKKRQLASLKVKRMFQLTDDLWNFIDEIQLKAVEMNVEFTLERNTMNLTAVESSVNEFIKFLEGMESAVKLTKKEEQRKKEVPQDMYHKAIQMSEKDFRFIEQIGKRAEELKVLYEVAYDTLLILGEESAVNQVFQFVSGICLANKSEGEDEWEKAAREAHLELGPYTQKQFYISNQMKKNVKHVEAEANKNELIFEHLDDVVLAVGYQRNLLNFLCWFYNVTVTSMDDEIKELKKNVKMASSMLLEEEWSISAFHRSQKQQILEKIKELKINCSLFEYDTIVVSGSQEQLTTLKAFLHEIETRIKKSLYPKYWDFRVKNTIAEVDVPNNTVEFQEVANQFYQSLKGVQITKLVRVQNKFLMDHYVTMIQKRQEFRGEIDLSRKLLFHGTRLIDPKKIYMSSDTGFDIQYSNPNGSYGKGIYFAVHSNYSHNGYTYNLGNGRYQMFLADVFVGKAWKGQQQKFVKAPDGFDSVESPNSFYIVYNNLHSYPLYLIEYTALIRN